MDFWDVLKLMARRWLLVLPLLLLTIGATAWTGMTVKPDYKATGHVTVLPPSVRTEQPADGKKQTVNPWTEEALAEAVIIRLQRKDLHDSLADEGYRGEWEVSADGLQPVVTIEVIAPSVAAARSTTRRLIEVVDHEVQIRQERYGLPAGEAITTETLDDGDTVEAVTSKLKRALVVVAGIGLIVTVMVVVGVDAILRRRTRNRLLKADADAAALLARLEGRMHTANGAAAVPGLALVTADASPTAASTADTAKREGPERKETDETTAVAVATAVITAPNGNDDQSGNSNSNSNGHSNSSGKDKRDGGEVGGGVRRVEPLPISEDATIVLPLSNAPWSTSADSGRNSHKANKR